LLHNFESPPSPPTSQSVNSALSFPQKVLQAFLSP